MPENHPPKNCPKCGKIAYWVDALNCYQCTHCNWSKMELANGSIIESVGNVGKVVRGRIHY